MPEKVGANLPLPGMLAVIEGQDHARYRIGAAGHAKSFGLLQAHSQGFFVPALSLRHDTYT